MTSRHNDDAVSARQLTETSLLGQAEEAPRYVQHEIFQDAPSSDLVRAANASMKRRAARTRVAAAEQEAAAPTTPARNGSWLKRMALGGDTAPTTSPSTSTRALTRSKGDQVMRSSLERPVTIAVIQTRGEAGKSVTTFGLGSALSAARGGGVVAWDNNEAPGNLADRLERSTDVGLRDLLDSAQYFLTNPDAKLVELERVLQHQPTGFLQVLAADPFDDAPAIDVEAFQTIHTILQKFFRVIVIDTGNSTRAANWRAAVQKADALVVPLKMRRDHLFPAGKMIGAVEKWLKEDLTDRVVLAVSCGPDDRHVTDSERDQIFTELNLHRFALTEIPTDPTINTAPILEWDEFARPTQQAYSELAAKLLRLITKDADEEVVEADLVPTHDQSSNDIDSFDEAGLDDLMRA